MKLLLPFSLVAVPSPAEFGEMDEACCRVMGLLSLFVIMIICKYGYKQLFLRVDKYLGFFQERTRVI